jgi:hypothetical protein
MLKAAENTMAKREETLLDRHRDLGSLRDEYAGYIMQEFVSEGGKGMKSALWAAMVAAIQWKEESDKAKGKK